MSQKQKELKHSANDERINKMWSIHTMGYYLTTKRNEVLPHITTWMNLESIMLTELNQTQKKKHCMIPIIGNK